MAEANFETCHPEVVMKIAVTSMGKEINSQVDPRFGRAQYIVILDQSGTVLEAVDNSQNLKGD